MFSYSEVAIQEIHKERSLELLNNWDNKVKVVREDLEVLVDLEVKVKADGVAKEVKEDKEVGEVKEDKAVKMAGVAKEDKVVKVDGEVKVVKVKVAKEVKEGGEILVKVRVVGIDPI